MIVPILLIFVMMGLLGLVLRWTFGRDRGTPGWPDERESSARSPAFLWNHLNRVTRNHEAPGRHDGAQRAAHRGSGEIQAGSAGDDFGLLVDAARVDDAEHAVRVRDRLAAAGIRATTAVGADGRPRVLVFAADIHRARRVAARAAGSSSAGPSAAAPGGSERQGTGEGPDASGSTGSSGTQGSAGDPGSTPDSGASGNPGDS